MVSVLDYVYFEVDNMCIVSQVKSIETKYIIMDRYIKNTSKGEIGSEMQESISYFEAALSKIKFE